MQCSKWIFREWSGVQRSVPKGFLLYCFIFAKTLVMTSLGSGEGVSDPPKPEVGEKGRHKHKR